MKAAVRSIDITPPIGLPIGGNIRDDNISRGIHDNLLCNIIVFEGECGLLCFLGLDLSGLNRDMCSRIKAQIAKNSGIDIEKIVITATHTHSGPDVLEFFKDEINQACIRYIEDTAKKISVGIFELKEQLEDVKIKIGKELVYDLSFNRRLIMKDGTMRMNWENVDRDSVAREAGPIDPELNVILLKDAHDNTKALMVNFTLHPAVLVGEGFLWSRDYIGYLDTCIKEKMGKDVVVFFSNGAEGNINHINYRDRNQQRGFAEARRIGEKLGSYVLNTVNNSQPVDISHIHCLSRIIKLPLRPISEKEVEWAYQFIKKHGDFIPSLLDGVPDEVFAREIIKLSKISDQFVETEIQVVAIGDTVISTIPGEAFVEFGIEIKAKSAYKNTLVFGLANDCLGYIPTGTAFEEGGYETKTASSSKLDKTAGNILVGEVLKLMEEIKNITWLKGG